MAAGVSRRQHRPSACVAAATEAPAGAIVDLLLNELNRLVGHRTQQCGILPDCLLRRSMQCQAGLTRMKGAGGKSVAMSHTWVEVVTYLLLGTALGVDCKVYVLQATLDEPYCVGPLSLWIDALLHDDSRHIFE